MFIRRFAALGVLALLMSCSQPPQSVQGSAGAQCYGNGTCNEGLKCKEGTCIVSNKERDEDKTQKKDGEKKGADDSEGARALSAGKIEPGGPSEGDFGDDHHDGEGEMDAPAQYPGMVYVTGGTYKRSVGGKTRTITLREFWIDETEVRAKSYAQCVEKGRCTPPETGKKGCDTERLSPNNWNKDWRVQHPINCVSWEQAQRYCQWRGKRLPTEAEWEKAAFGVTGQRFPWGDAEPSCSYAVLKEGKKGGCGRTTTAPVSSIKGGKSPFGAYDMMGNVWEWVQDKHDESFYRSGPDQDPVNNQTGSNRVIRGGSWGTPPARLESVQRRGLSGATRDDSVGFRCAK